jgi:hypothetical protein
VRSPSHCQTVGYAFPGFESWAGRQLSNSSLTSVYAGRADLVMGGWTRPRVPVCGPLYPIRGQAGAPGVAASCGNLLRTKIRVSYDDHQWGPPEAGDIESTLAGQRDCFEREDLGRFPCSTRSPVAVTGTR